MTATDSSIVSAWVYRVLASVGSDPSSVKRIAAPSVEEVIVTSRELVNEVPLAGENSGIPVWARRVKTAVATPLSAIPARNARALTVAVCVSVNRPVYKALAEVGSPPSTV